MRKQLIFFVFIFVFVTNAGFTQSIQDIMNDGNLNYYEKIALIEQDSGSLKNGVDESILKRYKRWRSFWDSRTGTDGSETAYATAWHSIFNSASLPVGGTGETWEFVGPNEGIMNIPNYMGQITCLATDPNNQNILYGGAMTGGLWKTTNPTDTYPHWECLTNDYAGMGVTDIVVHPDNSNTIFIVTGIHVNGMMKMTGDYSLGAYQSTDGGSTWNLLMNLLPEENIYLGKIVFDPDNSNIMYILSTTTVYKSTDGGNTWDDTNVGANDVRFRSIVINPANTNEIYISGNNAIYKTTNAGDTWLKITSLGHPEYSNVNVAWHPVENCIYALYNVGTNGILKKSVTSGVSWSYGNTIEYVMDYVNALTISPNGNIYAGGIRIYKSLNNGLSFSYNLNDMHNDIRDILFPNGMNDNLAYIATDGGVVRNTTGGNNDWVSCNGDLCVNQFYDIAISEQDPDLILGGSHDCGTLRRKTDGSWEHAYGGDGGTSKIRKDNKNIQLATVNCILKRSTDGENFNESTGINFMDMDGPFCFDPNNPNVIYTTTTEGPNMFSLLKSTNSGAEGSFNPIGGISGVYFDIEVSKANSNYIYVSSFDWWTQTYSRLNMSVNGGSTWEDYDFSHTHAPIRDIATHPEEPNKVWVVFGGLNEDYKVSYSPNGGVLWLNKTFNLPNLPINKILYDDVNERIIVATDLSVYYRNDGGIIWRKLGSGLPNMIVTDLELNRSTGDLFIGTFGRGIWKLHMAEYCFSNTPIISGTSIVCIDNKIFSIENVPDGFNIQWTKSSNLSYVSGQGLNDYTVKAINSTTSGSGWVKAEISGGECDPIFVVKNIWVGKPTAQIVGPTELAKYSPATYTAEVYNDSPIDNYLWTISSSLYAFSYFPNTNQSYEIETKGKLGTFYLYLKSTNTCGDQNLSKSIVVKDDGGGGGVIPVPRSVEETIIISPNPAKSTIDVKIKDENLDNKQSIAVILYNDKSIPIYQNNYNSKNFKIDVSSFSNGLYILQIVYNEERHSNQFLIEH